MEVKLSQARPIGFFALASLFSLIGHLPRPKVPRRLMKAPIGYRGVIVGLIVFVAFWSSRLLTGSLTGTKEPSSSLCHLKFLARTSLSQNIKIYTCICVFR